MGLSRFDVKLGQGLFLVADDTNTPIDTQVFSVYGAGYRLDQLSVTNNDSIDHNVTLAVGLYGYLGVIGQAVVPAGTGFDGSRPLDLMALFGWDLYQGLVFGPETTFRLGVLEAVNTAKQVTFFGIIGQL